MDNYLLSLCDPCKRNYLLYQILSFLLFTNSTIYNCFIYSFFFADKMCKIYHKSVTIENTQLFEK